MDKEQTQLKSLDLLVESLKLYVTLSTILLAGLLAYYATGRPTDFIWTFITGLVALLICAVASIWDLNQLVGDMYEGSIDIYKGQTVFFNWLAIIAFTVGVIASGAFLYMNRSTSLPSGSLAEPNTVRIQGNDIQIGSNVTTKITVQRDHQGNITTIDIN